MSKLERKVYESYAFENNEREKSKINHEIYEELKKKYRISSGEARYNLDTKKMERVNMDDYDLVYKREAAYNHGEYTVLKNETDLTSDEIALIMDGGNLCFGYTRQSENFFYIFED